MKKNKTSLSTQIKETHRWFKAIAWGVSVCLILFVAVLLVNRNSAISDKTRLQEIEATAMKGDAAAMNALGEAYNHTIHNQDKALYWYRKSAASGNSNAMYNLARAVRNISGSPPESEKMQIHWLKKAAYHGNFDAMLNLAEIYMGHIPFQTVNVDMKKAQRWMLMAARNARGNLSENDAYRQLLHYYREIPDEAKQTKIDMLGQLHAWWKLNLEIPLTRKWQDIEWQFRRYVLQEKGQFFNGKPSDKARKMEIILSL